MDKEVISRVIDKSALGNHNLKVLLNAVYVVSQSAVDSWPNEKSECFKKRSILAVEKLIGSRIDIKEMEALDVGYWETNNGKRVSEAVTSFVVSRIGKKY